MINRRVLDSIETTRMTLTNRRVLDSIETDLRHRLSSAQIVPE